jgi:hypothetical protein
MGFLPGTLNTRTQTDPVHFFIEGLSRSFSQPSGKAVVVLLCLLSLSRQRKAYRIRSRMSVVTACPCESRWSAAAPPTFPVIPATKNCFLFMIIPYELM